MIIAAAWFVVDVSSSLAAGPTVINKNITVPTTWTKSGSPYIVRSPNFGSQVYVSSNLTIEPGVIVKFDGQFSGLNISGSGSLNATGTEQENVIFTSYNDDTYGGDTNSDGNATMPKSGEWYAIINNGTATFENATLSYGASNPGTAAIFSYKNSLTVKHSTIRNGLYSGISLYNVSSAVIESNIIKDNGTGIRVERFVSGSVQKISNNTIVGNDVGAWVSGLTWWGPEFPLDASGNWWGDASGPYYKQTVYYGKKYFGEDNLAGKGNMVSEGMLFRPWLGSDPSLAPSPCTENCFSNVLFLPGIKASRLYKDGVLGSEDNLWLPNYFGNDLAELALDGNGKSINHVYTKDVLGEVAGLNIYKTFLEKLGGMKADKTINDYQSFAYDWRQNVEDIIKEGTPYPQSVTRSLTTDLDTLAQSSKSGKVTIIAHSNGGLLAKALMLELEKSGQADKIDKIVFVGTPQLGTPLSALSLLYGYDESLLAGTLISREDARTLAENMPGVYGLLPSEKYFERMDEAFMKFSSENTRYKRFKDIYGDTIDSADELKSFLSGAGDGRAKPAKSDVESENILGENFITQSMETHRRLDAWTPPQNIEVIQIAGWGLDTVSGVEYAEKEKTRCYASPSGGGGAQIPSCTGMGEYEPVYDPKFTVDGDNVVAAPSALTLSDAPNVKRYWVDLWSYDDLLTIGRSHRDLLEIAPLQQFLSNVITNIYTTASLPENIKINRPNPDGLDSETSRLRMSLYSPLDIHLYDSAGRHTGPKKIVADGKEQTIFETEISNSYYYQFGERKYVGFGGDEAIRIEMDGYDTGSYTLKFEEVKPTVTGEETIAHTTFENLPVTSQTKVSLAIPATGLSDLLPLSADVNGDGKNDYSVKPVPNGTAILDMIAPETKMDISGTEGKNGWYVSDASVSLSAADNEGGSGVESISYSLDKGTTWQIYAEPIVFSQEGTATLQYSATDKQGNKEDVKSMSIRIDKTAPEAKIGFDPSVQKMTVVGMDNFSANVAVTTTEVFVSDYSAKRKESEHGYSEREGEKDGKAVKIITTLTDEAGHTTVLAFLSDKNKDRRIRRTLESVSYDGMVTDLQGMSLRYKWQIQARKNIYAMMVSRLQSGSDGVEFHYRPKKNVTVIMQKPQDWDDRDEEDENNNRLVRETLPGMVVPYLQTEQGHVTIGYIK